MPRDGLAPATTNRRGFLKATAATIGISSIPLTVSAESKPDPVGVKGTYRRPVKQKHIENAREQALHAAPNVSSDTDQVVLAGDPIPDNGYLAGYAVVVADGAPIEQIFRVSEPQPLSEITANSKRTIGRTTTQRTDIAQSASSRGGMPSEYREQQERNAHESIEQFLAENGGK
ncbi:hypothetical protein [Halorhabdus sp. CBA1104]|uniref:hypothetical protein n=1 Tax=Halorhabdus sp. CBA1104 TaxID=1380432 RepID=UPI0012B1EEA9|nr:hypothetical protein [Halorhabdus sp. CBA1104]